MKLLLFAFVLMSAASYAQEWQRTEFHDGLHNRDGVKFVLASKEGNGGIAVICASGVLQQAWLLTEQVTAPQLVHFTGVWGETPESVTTVEYRTEFQTKSRILQLPMSGDSHSVLLQEHKNMNKTLSRSGLFGAASSTPITNMDVSDNTGIGLDELMYGYGREAYKAKKSGGWSKQLFVGVPANSPKGVLMTFDVPDPAPMYAECKKH